MQIVGMTVDEFRDCDDALALVEEYHAECAGEAFTGFAPNWDVYRELEDIGRLAVITAVTGSHLVGFAVVVFAGPSPHFAGAEIATLESLFVGAGSRATGAGLKLWREAKARAEAMGATHIAMSAGVGTQAERLYSLLGHRTGSTFIAKL